MRRVVFAVALCLVAGAARAANPIPQVFTCQKEGTVGGLGAGVDLTRYTIDVTRFPEAVCNDGTPAIFYYAKSTKSEDRNKWIIFLQGGGTCVDGQSCAERWCSIDTKYGYDKMTSSLAKPSIRGAGFMNPTPQNYFGSWNRVLVFYCSSDAWTGTNSLTTQANLNNSGTRDYQIHFKGARIVDAVLDTLRNVAPTSRRRIVKHGIVSDADTTPWPDLDDADAVLFAGSSAGCAGARMSLDRVSAKLRATNSDLDIAGIFDACYGTLGENLDYTKSTYCASDPVRGCRYDTFTQSVQLTLHTAFYGSHEDDSCTQWHTAHAPGTEWRCADGEHVELNHLSAPFFIHQDLQDTQIGGDWVEAGFGTPSDYANRVESELRNLQVPEEPRGGPSGAFAPQCTDHESFTNDETVFNVKLAGISYHDAVRNWWTHTGPQQVIRPFTGTPGPAPECP